MRSNVMEIRGVAKRYQVGQNAVRALDGVDLSVKAGEFICITGRSGSGKSTLLNLLAGLEKPTEGEIVILDQHIEAMNETERIRFRRKNVGFVFQSYNLLPQHTALENVAMPLALRGIALKERQERAMEVMRQVGIDTHAKHKPSEMSGGQQQRVGIARALATGPSIVFADEPTGNLDTRTSREVMELLISIFEQRGATFLLVSHDPQMRQYANRTIYLSDGRIADSQ